MVNSDCNINCISRYSASHNIGRICGYCCNNNRCLCNKSLVGSSISKSFPRLFIPDNDKLPILIVSCRWSKPCSIKDKCEFFVFDRFIEIGADTTAFSYSFSYSRNTSLFFLNTDTINHYVIMSLRYWVIKSSISNYQCPAFGETPL